jgi:hypothetical protein
MSRFHRHKTPMELSGRLYNCVSCYALVVICSPCDRNNIYCGSTCSGAARRRSCAMAAKRYQKSHRGRMKHAERQRHYRGRQTTKVTHHSSPVLPPRAVLPPEPNKLISGAVNGHLHCHFCGKPCSPFLRRGFLRHSGQNSPPRSASWPLAP